MSDGDDDEDGGEDEYEDIDPSEHDPNYAEVLYATFFFKTALTFEK